MATVKVKYVGAGEIVGPTQTFWLPGETHEVSEQQYQVLVQQHGEVFQVQGGEQAAAAPAEVVEGAPKRRK